LKNVFSFFWKCDFVGNTGKQETKEVEVKVELVEQVEMFEWYICILVNVCIC